MEDREFNALSAQAWAAELEAAKRKRIIRDQLTPEEARDYFARAAPTVLTGLAKSFINHGRKKKSLGPIPPNVQLPPAVAEWIADQVEAIDDVSGNTGSGTFRSVANSMLDFMRGIENQLH